MDMEQKKTRKENATVISRDSIGGPLFAAGSEEDAALAQPLALQGLCHLLGRQIQVQVQGGDILVIAELQVHVHSTSQDLRVRVSLRRGYSGDPQPTATATHKQEQQHAW